MDKAKIIESLYLDKECRDYCLKVSSNEFDSEDLFSYALEALLKKPDSFIKQKHNDGSLKRYFAGIVYKSYNSPNSPFFIEHLAYDRMSVGSEPKDIISEEDLDNTVGCKILHEALDAHARKGEQQWYESTVLRLYLKYGNLRDLSKATNIPHTSLGHTVNKMKQKLKKICGQYF